MSVGREVAIRLFASEFRQSTRKYTDGGDRSPSYVVSPMGARINRLFIAGTLTEVTNTGSDDDPVWKAKIVDGTGVFFISAGKYQPRAAAAISKIEPPQFVAVVGKSRLYSPDDTAHYLSVRPEAVRVIDRKDRDMWVVQAARGLKQRMEAFQEILKMETPSSAELISLGYPEHIAEGVALAYDYYGEPDMATYHALLIRALRSIMPGYEGEDEDFAYYEEEAEEKVDEDLQQTFLEMVEELDADDRGAEVSKLYTMGKKSGFSREDMENMLHHLLETGSVYEPQLGRIKRT